MRAYIQLIAMVCAAGCKGTIECCDDRTPPTYAVVDLTVLDPGGAPSSGRVVNVTSVDPAKCADGPEAGNPRSIASFTTDQNGRAVGSMTITPFLLSQVDACISFAVLGGPIYRDTLVSGFDVRFRQAGAPMDTVRAAIELTSK